MPRAKDAPVQVGGQIDPYVQRSIQQSKQLTENRLVTAIQEAGATGRTGMQEAGATQRTAMEQAGATQRTNIQTAAQLAIADKRAAEDEKARRDDMEFTKTMTKVTQEMQAKEAALDRDMQRAMFEGRREDTKEIAGKQLAWDKVRMILGERAQIRDTNLVLSMVKGMQKSTAKEEKAKTTMLGQADEFDMDKGKYEKAKESITLSIANDKRMDLPILESIKKQMPTKWDITKGVLMKGPILGSLAAIRQARGLGKEAKEGFADPMGVLQDQITKREGKISVEDLSSANIHRVVEQMAEEKIKTEDINETFGALHAMLGVVDEKRKGVDRKSDEFDFWNNTYNDISLFVRNLTKIEDNNTKIKGSETKTVGKEMIYALRTIRKGSLGSRVSRYKAAGGGLDPEALINEFSGPKEPYELFDLTADGLDKYDIEAQSFINDMIVPLYQETEVGGLE